MEGMGINEACGLPKGPKYWGSGLRVQDLGMVPSGELYGIDRV